MVESYVIPLICDSLLVVLLGCIRLLDLRANKLPTSNTRLQTAAHKRQLSTAEEPKAADQ